MWRSYNEDWERRKSYLIRSLFHDTPLLSPVPEESNPSDEPSWSRRDAYRSPSPLPSLIVEKEPNRHDEPEEYYKVLEIKIRKIYRKLFIEGRDLSDSDYWVDDYDLAASVEDSNGDHVESNDVVMADNQNDNNNDSLDVNSPENYAPMVRNHNSDYVALRNHDQVNGVRFNSWRSVDNVEKNKDGNEVNSEENDVTINGFGRVDVEMNSVNNDQCSAADTSGYSADYESTEDISGNLHENSCTEYRKEIGLELRNISIPSLDINMPDDVGEVDRDENNNCNNTLNEVSEAGNREELTESDGGPEDISGLDFRQITTQAVVHVDSTDIPEKLSVVYEESVKSIILVPRQQYQGKVTWESEVREEYEMIMELEENIDPEGVDESNVNTEVDKVIPEETNKMEEEIEVMRTQPTQKASTDSMPLITRSDSDNTSEYSPKFEARTREFGARTKPNDNNLEFDGSLLKPSANTVELETSTLKFQARNSVSEVSGPEMEHLESVASVMDYEDNFPESETSNSASEAEILTSGGLNLETIEGNPERSDIYEEIGNPSLTRKRKAVEDTAVQTSGNERSVGWNDLCGNFFVGTPKVFRLCSCDEHVCC